MVAEGGEVTVQPRAAGGRSALMTACSDDIAVGRADGDQAAQRQCHKDFDQGPSQQGRELEDFRRSSKQDRTGHPEASPVGYHRAQQEGDRGRGLKGRFASTTA